MTDCILPYTTVSVAMSLDGYIDDSSPQRLVLSNALDLDSVRELRSSHDAILVGANTVRRDNPALVIECEGLREQRREKGLKDDLIKVVLTRSGNLDPRSLFFEAGLAPKFVYCPSPQAKPLSAKLGKRAEVIALPENRLTMKNILADLGSRGVKRLLVEGGEAVLTSLFSENLVHELRLSIAPYFVGEKTAPRLVGPAKFPFNKTNRMKLTSVTHLGDIAVLTYRLD